MKFVQNMAIRPKFESFSSLLLYIFGILSHQFRNFQTGVPYRVLKILVHPILLTPHSFNKISEELLLHECVYILVKPTFSLVRIQKKPHCLSLNYGYFVRLFTSYFEISNSVFLSEFWICEHSTDKQSTAKNLSNFDLKSKFLLGSWG